MFEINGAKPGWVSACCAVAAVAALSSCGAGSESASNYPTRQITFVAPFNAGGTTDTASRLFADLLEQELDGNITVQNQSGASGSIGTVAITTAAPNGYTIGSSSNSALAFNPLVSDDVSYQPNDYDYIAKIGINRPVLTVAADAPWATLEEFVEDARSQPGEIRVSTSGELTESNRTVLVMNKAADIELNSVPFTGGGSESLAALLSGEVDANISYGATVEGQVDAGELRVLGIVGEEPSTLFPDATPFVAAGYDVTQTYDIYAIAPTGTPDGVMDVLRTAAKAVVTSDEYAQQAAELGITVEYKKPAAIRDEVEAAREDYRDVAEMLRSGD